LFRPVFFFPPTPLLLDRVFSWHLRYYCKK